MMLKWLSDCKARSGWLSSLKIRYNRSCYATERKSIAPLARGAMRQVFLSIVA